MPEEKDHNNKATFNVIISYSERTKAILTLVGFNKEQVQLEVEKQCSHMPDLVVETVDLIDGEEANTDNVVEFNPKDTEKETK